MKTLLKCTLVVLIAGIAFTSCNNKSGIGSLIPSDALFVSYFNTPDLLEKLPYDSIKATQIFKDIIADSSISTQSKQVLNDLSTSGIDLNKGLAIFANKSEGDTYYLALSGFIAGESAFETFNKNLDPTGTISNDKGVKNLVIKNESLVGWDKNHFVYLLGINGMERRSGDENESGVPGSGIAKEDLTAAKNYLLKLFDLSSSASLAKEEKFNALIKDQSDIKVWINTEKISQLPSLGALSLLKLNDLLKDSRTTYSVNFENGKITAEQKSYYGKELTSLLKKYQGDKLKAEDFSKIPSSDVLAAIGLNFKPEGIREFLKLAGLDGFLNMFSIEMGISSDDLINSINGKIVGSFSDLKINRTNKKNNANSNDAKTDQLPSEDDPAWPGFNSAGSGADFNGLLAIGVGNKTAIKKLIDTISQSLGMAMDISPDKMPFTLSDNELVISNNKNFREKYLKNHSTEIPDWAKKISGQLFGLYVDINKILQSLPAEKDSSIAKSISLSLRFWKEIISTGGDLQGSAISIKSEISLMDTQRNSLAQLNSYIDELYKINKQKLKNVQANRYKIPATSDKDSSSTGF